MSRPLPCAVQHPVAVPFLVLLLLAPPLHLTRLEWGEVEGEGTMATPGDVVIAPPMSVGEGMLAVAPLGVVEDKVEDKVEEKTDKKEKSLEGGEITDTESEAEGTHAAPLPPHPPPPIEPVPGSLSCHLRVSTQKRPPKKCEHGRQKSQCKDCKGELVAVAPAST